MTKRTQSRRFYVTRYLATELKALLYRSSHNFSESNFINILPTTSLYNNLLIKSNTTSPDVCRTTSLDRTQSSTQSTVYTFSESHLCRHIPYNLPTEMKSRKGISRILSKLSIPQLNTNFYIPPSTNGTQILPS